MYPVNELSLADLSGSTALFWSRGNAPTQKTEHLEAQELRLHFIAAYLLADKVVASASFYYESLNSREVTRDFGEIFYRGDALYFVDDSMDGFHAHARRKKEKSPPDLHCYHDSDLLQGASNELAAFGHILRRPDISVSGEIVRLWLADLMCPEEGSLGWSLAKVCKDNERFLAACERLQSLCASRGEQDFVWEFIEPMLRRIGLPRRFLLYAERRLAQFYSVATGAILRLPVDNALRLGPRGLGPSSQYDTSLFLECMEAMGVKQLLAILDVRAIIKLKASAEFLIFRAFYFVLIDAARYSPTQLSGLLPLYARVERNMPSITSGRDVIVRAFSSWCHKTRGEKKKYVLALNMLLDAYDAFGSRVIRDLSSAVAMLAKANAGGECSAGGKPSAIVGVVRSSVFKHEEALMVKAVFIGHGRSKVWRELKDFLQDRLGVTVEEFNREPMAGINTTERLEQMLTRTSFAFIILTAEDEHSDGSRHARENVIHEVGLFQGRHGFRRAIVVLEEGCAEFSNISGLGQIRFASGDLIAKSEEIRWVLERENILP